MCEAETVVDQSSAISFLQSRENTVAWIYSIRIYLIAVELKMRAVFKQAVYAFLRSRVLHSKFNLHSSKYISSHFDQFLFTFKNHVA